MILGTQLFILPETNPLEVIFENPLHLHSRRNMEDCSQIPPRQNIKIQTLLQSVELGAPCREGVENLFSFSSLLYIDTDQTSANENKISLVLLCHPRCHIFKISGSN